MKSRLLLSAAAAAAWLAAPAVTFADPPADHRQNDGGWDQRRHPAKGDHGDRKPAEAHPGAREAPPRPAMAGPDRAGPEAGRPGARIDRRPEPRTYAPPREAEMRPAPPPARAEARPAERRARQESARPAPPVLGDWNRTARGPDRDQAGQQWRQSHQGWDRSAPWRRSPDWWRHDEGFRRYAGHRVGFFYIPQMGYISVPARYRNHYWQSGEYLPDWFWRYEVRDYRRYGLPRPPIGCGWVWLDGDVALIDRSDGYILDVVHNLW